MRNFILLALLSGLLIGTLHSMTRDTILRNAQAFAREQLRSVINGADEDIVTLDNNLYLTRLDDSATGFIFEETTTNGYNGFISSWIAIDMNQVVRGVRIILHQETPGIGDKIDLTVSDWIRTFDGSSLEDNTWALSRVGGDFDHFTGATITSNATISMVRSGLVTADKYGWMAGTGNPI